MGPMSYYLASVVFLILYLGITWVVTGLLHLTGTVAMMVRTLLTTLGFAAFAYVTWRVNDRQRRAAAGSGGASATPAGEPEIDFLIRQAEARLAGAQLGRNSQIGSLPVIFVVGETGAAKTSVFVNSGLEPDLLAGQVYQDKAVVATRPANLWLARKAVFVEAGGRLLADSGRWVHLIRKVQPRRLRSMFRQRHAAPRAAFVCVDCESFLRPGTDDALASTARALNARLGEIAQALGSALPTYVLFTKVDRIAFFAEFFGTLRDEEIHDVLGATLPLRNSTETGVYAEQEARRLTAAFNDLFLALCDRRPTFLLREHDEKKLPNIYEFPREFRKLRNPLVRFLVDLGKPSQLRANPFLRGFYFSGVRPRVISEESPRQRAAAFSSLLQAEATGIFDADRALGTPESTRVATERVRRVPQWLFLRHLFNDVVLQDHVARDAAAVSSRTELMRRALLVGCTALLAIWAVGMTASWFSNRALESRVEEAARGISQQETGGAAQQLPSIASLQRLDNLRQSVALLSQYQREGPPLSLRWGLYSGDAIYPAARHLYFGKFHQIMFGATQTSLMDWLRKLPSKPGPNDSYKYTYETLKAYLMTTSYPEKSTRMFLSPLLMDRWIAGREIDPDRRALAQQQFDFYAEELAISNPFSKENDTEAIEHARYYLAQFNAVESIYQFMLSEAARQNRPVNFNKQFPGSAAYIVNNKDVSGAFTTAGQAFMQDAIKNLRRFFGGENWVLGDKAYANLDPAQAAPELIARYQRDLIANWRAYLANSEVVRYSSIADAAQKLGQLSSNQSFLMSLFCLATNNTITAPEPITAIYQPVHYVQPAGCSERPVRENNAAYMSALAALQTSLDRTSKSPAPDDALVQQTLNDAANGYKVTRQVAQNFRLDKEGNVHGMVQKLMEDPIRYAEGVVGRIGPAQLNTEGRRLCGPMIELSKKYPFNTSSKIDATMAEIDAIFRPGDGKIATFYDANLKNYVDRHGSDIQLKPDSRVHINEGFLRFFSRALSFSDALYKDGKTPRLSYSMKAMPAPGLSSVTLVLDGQTLRSSGSGGDGKEFVWPGTSVQSARLGGSLGGSDLSFITYDGLWAAFRLFGDADRFQASGSGYSLQWIPRQGQSGQPIRLGNGSSVTLSFTLDLKGAPPVFQKGYLSSVQCVSDVAR